MKKFAVLLLALVPLVSSCCCGRGVRVAHDITPGNCLGTRLDWRYGAGDIRIQTYKLCPVLMERWFLKTGYNPYTACMPRLIITGVDNCTDQYISTDMIRDIFEEVAANDGRYTVVAGNAQDEKELDERLKKYAYDPQYANATRPNFGNSVAPQFLAKVRLTKAVTSSPRYDYEDYRMTVTLYDIETGVIIDSESDVLRKQVHRCR